MKRWISSLMLAGLSTYVLAQAPFTIVRPADGSNVRENVRVLIPKDSVPPGSYVGVFLDGKLIEATVPPIEGKYRVYTLDTKARGIPDTNGKPIKLELVLYTDVNNQSRILERSSVDIQVGNQANIKVPNNGLTLRYTFKPGTEMVYDLNQAVQVSSITADQQKLGGKAAEMDVEHENIRLLYSVDNAYTDGSGLLRMQPLPMKGKDYADLTVEGSTEQRRFTKDEMAPVYMRITSTGSQIFGALPPSIPLFGTSAGSIDPMHLYAHWPLPTLPVNSVRPGDSWASRFQLGDIDLAKYPNIDSVVTPLKARGEFIDVEWEQGHPCARIQNTIEEANMNSKQKAALSELTQSNEPISDDKISIVETIWFSLDTHKVLKVLRDTTIDTKTQVQQGGFPGMGAPSTGSSPDGSRPRGPKLGAPGGAGPVGFTLPPAVGALQGGRKLPGAPGGGQGPGGMGRPGGAGMGRPGGAGMGRPGGPGMGMPGMGMGQPPAPKDAYVRVRLMQTFTLEQ